MHHLKKHRMRIALVGSFEPTEGWTLQGTENKLRDACREIGYLVAELGHHLVIQYDQDRCRGNPRVLHAESYFPARIKQWYAESQAMRISEH
jgi:hypothetical protein